MNGIATLFVDPSGLEPGVVTDGNYFFTTDGDNTDTEISDSDLHIYDYSGTLLESIDLRPWWSSPAGSDSSDTINFGPTGIAMRNGMLFLNSSISCIQQMVDPYRFLDSRNSEDFVVWENTNGDYTMDRNFAETADQPWVCNGTEAYDSHGQLNVDNNLFSFAHPYDFGAVHFSLMAPDGTGLGFFKSFRNHRVPKSVSFIVDGGTAYDGIYSDNLNHFSRYKPTQSYTFVEIDGEEYQINSLGTFFIAHDSIKGVITSNTGTSVKESSPAPFTLSQNSPNPFNPVTTIPFTLPDESAVTLTVYNITGEKVTELIDGTLGVGNHSVNWDASGVGSGMYFARLRAGEFVATVKMTVVK